MDKATLITQIAKAFPASPLPQVSLRQAVLADQTLTKSISDTEWETERLKDGHIAWPSLSDETLIECGLGLAHLDEQSFVYYIAAFLRFAVKHIDASLLSPEGELLGTVVFSVTHTSNYNLARLKHLNDAQIDCVIEFLRLVQERSKTHGADASKALVRYWQTPEARRKTVVYVP